MYNGQVNLLSLDPAIDAFVGQLLLRAHWLEDGSALTRLDEDRVPQPDLADSGLGVMSPFAVDDEGFEMPVELVFTVADEATGELLFRSRRLSSLPAPVTASAGFFQVIRAATSPSFTTLNEQITARFAGGPVTQDAPPSTGPPWPPRRRRDRST